MVIWIWFECRHPNIFQLANHQTSALVEGTVQYNVYKALKKANQVMQLPQSHHRWKSRTGVYLCRCVANLTSILGVPKLDERLNWFVLTTARLKLSPCIVLPVFFCFKEGTLSSFSACFGSWNQTVVVVVTCRILKIVMHIHLFVSIWADFISPFLPFIRTFRKSVSVQKPDKADTCTIACVFYLRNQPTEKSDVVCVLFT